MLPNRIVHYDVESTGTDKQTDQILQLAYVTTDANLNLVEGGTGEFLARMRPDVIPHPMAFLTHRIDPRRLLEEGMTEYELLTLARRVFMGMGNTCISGYNTIAFDDEIMRNSLFRNMRDAYDWSWKEGNSRADMYKLTQLVYAYCPDILSWPAGDDGEDSLKLDRLAPANGVTDMQAHDALSDVRATIAVARKIREANPKLWQYFLSLSDKNFTTSMMSKREPLLVTNTMLGKENRMTTLVYPVCTDALVSTKYLTFDLREDPSTVLSMSPEEIRHYAFTKREELPEHSPTIPVVAVATNKQPLVVQTSKMLTPDLADRLNLDLDACARHREMLEKDVEFRARLREAFTSDLPSPKNPARTLYTGGFADRKERTKMDALHIRTSAEDPTPRIFAESAFSMAAGLKEAERKRFFPLILRTKMAERIRDYLQTPDLSPVEAAELAEYTLYLQQVLAGGFDDQDRSLDDFRAEANLARLEHVTTEEDEALLGVLEAHMDRVESLVGHLAERVSTPEYAALLQQACRDHPEVSALMSSKCRELAGIEATERPKAEPSPTPSP